jgi:hypothetical protein
MCDSSTNYFLLLLRANRIYEHLRDTRLFYRDKLVAYHFNTNCHSAADVRVDILEMMHDPASTERNGNNS